MTESEINERLEAMAAVGERLRAERLARMNLPMPRPIQKPQKKADDQRGRDYWIWMIAAAIFGALLRLGAMMLWMSIAAGRFERACLLGMGAIYTRLGGVERSLLPALSKQEQNSMDRWLEILMAAPCGLYIAWQFIRIVWLDGAS